MAHSLAVRRYGMAHGSHAHDHVQVLFGLDGVLALEVDGRGQRVRSGEGCVIAPGERHDFEAIGTARCLVLDTCDSAWLACIGRALPAHLSPLAHYLADACEAGRPRARLLGPSLLLEAWAPVMATPLRARRTVDWQALTAWAQAHAHRDLTVADLAAQVHLSPAQFTSRCREALGQSPMNWLRALRLDHALALRLRGMAVADVAHRTGYHSPSALTAALRRHQGR